ncbi:hypothetical protein DFH08DRAFT_837126 [Mycena albidolilacea]|uniref:NAD(P)-binding protein n=1 Tax=Mycena albidolilacea TaxID=1033008 RepID=A0AAD7AST1_9AGAR|nr:hypothetical protein DFH08DRAFT_837126 [Mycena albidolilacea]
MVHTILVTGSNQGLGLHTVQQLGSTPNTVVFMGSRNIGAAKEALAKFVTDIHSASTVVPVQLDITDDSSIKAMHVFITDFLKKKGIPTLDVLVNNAAIGSESFKETVNVNVVGTVAITKAFHPLLTKAKDNSSGGTILNISIGLGSTRMYTKGTALLLPVPAYSVGKAVLNSLTAQWALQEKEKKSGIHVVSICPGFNATRLNGYTGISLPSEGCKVIVKVVLEKDGRTGVFFNKDEDLEW